MADIFIPDGHLTLNAASAHAAGLMFGSDLARLVTEDEYRRVLTYNAACERQEREARRQQTTYQSAPIPDDIAEIKTIASKRTSQIREAVSRLRQLLYATTLPAWVLTDYGNTVPVPHSMWGGKEFDKICDTGKATFSTGNPYIPTTVEGRVILRVADLDRLMEPAASPSSSIVATPKSKVISPPEPVPIRAKGGRPQEYQWDAIWIEACRILHDEGVPATQAEMRRKLLDWCNAEFGTAPDDATLKPKISRLFKVLNRDEN